MTRLLRFFVFDENGKDIGGWHRPRGATPAHREQHLMLDKNLVDWHKAHGHRVVLRRTY